MSADLATTIEAERRLLVERLQGLPCAQWATPTACTGWTVQHVLAHLTIPFLVEVPAMGLAFVRHRSISRAMDAATQRLAERDPEELLSVLSANASSRFRPPGLPLAGLSRDGVSTLAA
jgi:uncharacterized protein (TIGR03083 family)